MLVRAYLPKIITALFGGLFIAAGILTFGNALVFDRIFIGILLFTGFICRKDINVLGIILILAVIRVLEEALWFIFAEQLYNHWLSKITIYLLLFFIIYKFWFDKMSKISLLILLLCISAEIYWIIIGYTLAPAIYWYAALVGLGLLTRHFLFSRIQMTEQFTSKSGKSINLDWYIYQVTRIYIFIEGLNIFEYILRHVFQIKYIQIIYYVYPYIMQSLATFTLWIVFNEANKLFKERLISA
ncbi:hypothetical protein [Paraglaciecola sp. 20A4]|uniref:hypothetical protein n=1 Tax=Paraglaciecola sp. 20A4 TaxID=2687288 RepID=UPI00140A4F34|nr:hypothetical protein [Paraglaciecola sp. 20A4]